MEDKKCCLELHVSYKEILFVVFVCVCVCVGVAPESTTASLCYFCFFLIRKKSMGKWFVVNQSWVMHRFGITMSHQHVIIFDSESRSLHTFFAEQSRSKLDQILSGSGIHIQPSTVKWLMLPVTSQKDCNICKTPLFSSLGVNGLGPCCNSASHVSAISRRCVVKISLRCAKCTAVETLVDKQECRQNKIYTKPFFFYLTHKPIHNCKVKPSCEHNLMLYIAPSANISQLWRH